MSVNRIEGDRIHYLPMEILDKLRELLNDSEFDIVSFISPVDDYITVKLAYYDKNKRIF